MEEKSLLFFFFSSSSASLLCLCLTEPEKKREKHLSYSVVSDTEFKQPLSMNWHIHPMISEHNWRDCMFVFPHHQAIWRMFFSLPPRQCQRSQGEERHRKLTFLNWIKCCSPSNEHCSFSTREETHTEASLVVSWPTDADRFAFVNMINDVPIDIGEGKWDDWLHESSARTAENWLSRRRKVKNGNRLNSRIRELPREWSRNRHDPNFGASWGFVHGERRCWFSH